MATVPNRTQAGNARRLIKRSLLKPETDANATLETDIIAVKEAITRLTGEINVHKCSFQQQKTKVYEIELKIWTNVSLHQTEKLQKDLRLHQNAMERIKKKLKTIRGHRDYYQNKLMLLEHNLREEKKLSLLAEHLVEQEMKSTPHPPTLAQSLPTGMTYAYLAAENPPAPPLAANSADNKGPTVGGWSNPSTATVASILHQTSPQDFEDDLSNQPTQLDTPILPPPTDDDEMVDQTPSQ